MVCATVAFTKVITSTPKKLKIVAIIIAFFGLIALVETQVAMALGASVQPFTKITPRVSITIAKNDGFDINCCKKLSKVMLI
jgi:uncharacterized membrane protein